MSVLWTASDAAKATGGRTRGDWQASGVSIDTRTLAPGDLFVALTDIRDGHDFVEQALAKGAAAALVSRVPEGVENDAPLLIVDDVLAALEDLGRAARKRTSAKVIAVTGSVGKTSTKDMLCAALKGQGQVHAAVKSLNNHWGVPLTLARMPQDTDFAIIEIGMNHAGEITPLSKLARPHVALITTVAEAHMAAFSSVTDIAHAKAEIFTGVEPGGTAILNLDIETYEILAESARQSQAQIVTFGEAELADYRMVSLGQHNNSALIKATVLGEPLLYKIPASGRHMALNSMAVLAAVAAVDGDLALAVLDLSHWHPPAGRGERSWIVLDPVEDVQRLELIDDAYNANPTSMAAAFEVLAASTPVDGLGRVRRGRRVAFLTDMLELGTDEAARHRALADLPTISNVDTVHTAGPLMQELHVALPAEIQGEWHDSAEKLAAGAYRLLDAGDVVMVKGSKGSRAALVVDAIRKLGQAKELE